ncbi:MAG: YraN family protein [Coriobacteriia bacterium]|nr:YraN family protein [Coriobacteriia bacterium]
MSDSHIKLGRAGEFAACAFYELRDAIVLERNWRCQFGEVDIIALDNGFLAFCEVKTRKSVSAGDPEEQIGKDRQERYIRCAQIYCEQCDVSYEGVRFDVIAVKAHNEHSGELHFIPNAFGED